MQINRRAVELNMRDWKQKSGIGNIRKMMYQIAGNILIIYCSRPGQLIGNNKVLLKEFGIKLTSLGIKDIQIVEVEDALV